MPHLYNQQRLIQYNQLITKKFEQPTKDYKDKYQIELDVKRSFNYLKNNKPLKELQETLDYVFYHSQMSYIQGFHDICATLVLISENAKYIAYALAMNQFAPFLQEDGINSAELMCQHAFNIIKVHDKVLANFLKDVPPSFFISWILTAFQHDLTLLESKLKVLDFVILESVDFLVYLTASFLSINRTKLISFGGGDNQTLTACSELRHLGDVPFEDILEVSKLAVKLRHKYPYEKVKQWKDKDISKLRKSAWTSYIMAFIILLLSILILQFDLLTLNASK